MYQHSDSDWTCYCWCL